MKKFIFVLCLALAAPAVGCALVKQSNRAHHAVEEKTSYDVDKVLVKVKNGRKSVIVHTTKKVPKEDHKMIKEIVLEVVPDAHKVVVVKASKSGKKKK